MAMKKSTGGARTDRRWRLAGELHSAAIHLLRRLRIQDLACGIGPAKLSALSVLVFSGRPLSLAELANAEQVRNPTMSRLVAGMKRDGLVRTTASKQDSRSIQITTTSRGKALLMAGRKRRVRALKKALTALDELRMARMEESISALRQVIRRI